MTSKEHPIQVLCDAHMIPIMMFLREKGPSAKTEIYSAVGRSANMPAKIDRLKDTGLVTIEVVGISEIVGLTDVGSRIAETLAEVDALMSSQ